MADERAGLRVIDISNPQNPREVEFYDTPGFAEGVYVSGSYAYVAAGGAGLFVLRFTGAINHPPYAPTLLSPADGATVSPTPTFKLKAQDPDGDQIKFEIQVTKGNETKTFTTGFFASEAKATFTVPSDQALSSGQWSWKARAIDTNGAYSNWSETKTFTVEVTNHPPSVPVLISPANNATVSRTPTFRLKADDQDNDDVMFRIEAKQGGITKVFKTEFFASGSEAIYTVPSNLAFTDGQWSWRAKAIDKRSAESE